MRKIALVEVVLDLIDYVFQTGWFEERMKNEDFVVVAFHERGHRYSRLVSRHLGPQVLRDGSYYQRRIRLRRHSESPDCGRPESSRRPSRFPVCFPGLHG
jgi:hypothetical protein